MSMDTNTQTWWAMTRELISASARGRTDFAGAPVSAGLVRHSNLGNGGNQTWQQQNSDNFVRGPVYWTEEVLNRCGHLRKPLVGEVYQLLTFI